MTGEKCMRKRGKVTVRERRMGREREREGGERCIQRRERRGWQGSI